jgi:hypothetical protein
MKLAFDLHGVIMHLKPVMKKYFREVIGFELSETGRFSFGYPDSYDPRRFGVDIANSIITMAPEHAKPMHGAVPALHRWMDKGNRLEIITASAKSTMDANCEWLDKWINRKYTIHRVSWQEGKLDVCNRLGVTHFVDDRFKTCNDLVKGGLKQAYLVSAKHNEGREPDEGVVRVSGVKKAIEHYEQ